ncbi:sterile alpha motif domain-containing 9-like protein [Labeo rohita]|uniref:Sterile alpha motif domain-containing 9-like protein n=1 Tax=Labeo rohita TaxID=84645 RepID=A0A498MSN6_LABRO|nr:sterile alpha motif domain-containing 9-like protein [Labeo rohita]
MADEFHRKYEKQNKPVLLLVIHEDDKPLRYLIKSLQSKLQHRTDHPAFIIINAVSKSAVRVPGIVKIKIELLPDEKKKFAKKMEEIKKKYKKTLFHAFILMQEGFQREYAKKVITEKMVKLDKNHRDSSSTRLLSFPY